MTGDEFRAARERLGLKRAELAKRLRVTERAVQAWELETNGVPGPVEALMEILVKCERKEQHRPQPPRKRAVR